MRGTLSQVPQPLDDTSEQPAAREAAGQGLRVADEHTDLTDKVRAVVLCRVPQPTHIAHAHAYGEHHCGLKVRIAQNASDTSATLCVCAQAARKALKAKKDKGKEAGHASDAADMDEQQVRVRPSTRTVTGWH